MLTCSAEPVWPTCDLQVGQTVIYQGECVDQSDRPGKRLKHVATVETSLTIFSIRDGVAEGAVMTIVTPCPEKSIANAAVQISGIANTEAPKPIIRVALVRFRATGQIERATLPVTPPPYETLKYTDCPAPPLDGCPVLEFGVWSRKADPKQPKIDWTQHGDELWNGSRVLDFVGRQQPPEFDDLTKAAGSWRRTDRHFVSPIDGLARAMVRTIEQREGKQIVATNTMTLSMAAPPAPLDAAAIRKAKAHAHAAAWYGTEADRVLRDRDAAIKFRDQVARVLNSDSDQSRFRVALENLAK